MTDEVCRLGRIKTVSACGSIYRSEVEYIIQRLVVETGENAEWLCLISKDYKRSEERLSMLVNINLVKNIVGKKVLIVRCGNSGMEVSLDLCSQNPKLSMVFLSSIISHQCQETDVFFSF
ncbi:hypothetical protein AgCh_034974 [Apium graveolens]